MKSARAAVLIGLALVVAAPAFAADVPAQVAAVRRSARAAVATIPRSTRGGVVKPDVAATRYRNVRGVYKVNELVNDRITLCGEVDFLLLDGTRTGWIKFMWTPGDPNELATERRDVGDIHQIGPEVRARHCDPALEPFLETDFTADMQGGANVATAAAADD